jgi:hypothetical protein
MKVNVGYKMLEEQIRFGQIEEGKIFETPEGVYFAFDSANVEIGLHWGLVTLSKSDILKMAEIINKAEGRMTKGG